jgi:hypothetical protein
MGICRWEGRRGGSADTDAHRMGVQSGNFLREEGGWSWEGKGGKTWRDKEVDAPLIGSQVMFKGKGRSELHLSGLGGAKEGESSRSDSAGRWAIFWTEG